MGFIDHSVQIWFMYVNILVLTTINNLNIDEKNVKKTNWVFVSLVVAGCFLNVYISVCCYVHQAAFFFSVKESPLTELASDAQGRDFPQTHEKKKV